MNYEQILSYIEKKLVSEQSHPEDPDVRIFNYTQVCQYEKAWDDVTRNCRGLIMNVKTGEILARPFPKFFNYQEHLANGWPIPDGEPIISEKLDGSLGILYELGGKAWIATRGSFMSEQAVWATEWFRENVNLLPTPGITDLFEIVIPWNRIVVNYDFSGLVHLVSHKNDSLQPIKFNYSLYPAVRKPRYYPYTNLESLAAMDEPNSEGFVLLYPDGTRMKIKFPEYVRLHKLVTGLSEIAIWEHLKGGGKIEDLIQNVPDEFYDWVTDVAKRISEEYASIAVSASSVVGDVQLSEAESRKEQAEIITKSKYPGISFAMLDGKEYTEMIYKLIRPRGKSQFKTDIDS